MNSETKSRILDLHRRNTHLNTPAPSLMVTGAMDFGADERYAPIDERMIATAAEALEAGQTHYVDVPGIGPLRAAIADYLRTAFNGQYQQANVIVTAGIQESRFLTLQMIGDSVERVAVPEVVHPGVKKALGVRPLQVETMAVDAQGLPPIAEIRKVLEAGNRLLFLESPSRLTGAAYSAESVAAIAEAAAQFEAVIIWDQGLAPWAEGYVSLAAKAPGQTVAIGEAFPGMGLASWFIGYIAAPEKWIAPMQSQKQIMAICTSTAAQYAALEASKLAAESHASQLPRLNAARQALIAALDTTEVIPGATASVVALRLSAGKKQPVLKELKDAGYNAADGADFGMEDVLRLTISQDSTALLAVANVIKGA